MRKGTLLLLSFFIAIVILKASPVRAAEIRILAAASLADVLPELVEAYGDIFDVEVEFDLASSGACYQRLKQGEEADIFLSANMSFVDKAMKDGIIKRDSRRIFAGNRLVLAVPSGNPAGIESLEELLSAGVKRIVLGDLQSVPAGQYAGEALRREGLWERLKSKYVYAEDVREVLACLKRRDGDAGFIYRTDAREAMAGTDVAFILSNASPIRYWGAVTRDSSRPEQADGFVAFLKSYKARGILKRHGFSGAG